MKRNHLRLISLNINECLVLSRQIEMKRKWIKSKVKQHIHTAIDKWTKSRNDLSLFKSANERMNYLNQGLSMKSLIMNQSKKNHRKKNVTQFKILLICTNQKYGQLLLLLVWIIINHSSILKKDSQLKTVHKIWIALKGKRQENNIK